MWKIKEFIDVSSYVDETINQFIERNNIEKFEIIGYEVKWHKFNKDFYTFVLIKYWEED